MMSDFFESFLTPPPTLNLIFTFYNPIYLRHFRQPPALKSDIIHVRSLIEVNFCVRLFLHPKIILHSPLLPFEEAPLIARFEHTLVNQQLNTLVRVTPVVDFEGPEMFSKSIGTCWQWRQAEHLVG